MSVMLRQGRIERVYGFAHLGSNLEIITLFWVAVRYIRVGTLQIINACASRINKVSRSSRPHILISRPYLRRWFKAILRVMTTSSIAALGRVPPSGLSLVHTSLYVLPSSLCVFAPCTVLGSEGNFLILNYMNHKLAFGPYLRPQPLARYPNFGACLREVFSEERSSIRWLPWPVWS